MKYKLLPRLQIKTIDNFDLKIDETFDLEAYKQELCESITNLIDDELNNQEWKEEI
jgi:hypothetical protein